MSNPFIRRDEPRQTDGYHYLAEKFGSSPIGARPRDLGSGQSLQEALNSPPDHGVLAPAMGERAKQALAKAVEKYLPASGQEEEFGDAVLAHPINFEVAVELRKANPHLSSCLDALRNAIIGQGLEDEALEDTLDSMCANSFQDVMERATDDMLATGIGYIEVIRKNPLGKTVADAGPVAAFSWIPSKSMYFEREPRFRFDLTADGDGQPRLNIGPGYHFAQNVIQAVSLPLGPSSDGPYQTSPRFALCGDRDRLFGLPEFSGQAVKTEVIPLVLPTNLWRYYGAPRHLSAAPYIELISEALQQRFDFFHNRGIPDFLLFLRGASLTKDQKEDLQTVLNASSGQGNKGKSAAFTLPGSASEVGVDLLRMGVDYEIDKGLVELHDMGALSLASSTRVAPVIAGVTVAGKMGAANETLQAMIMLEVMQTQQMRKNIEKALRKALSKEAAFNGKKFKFNTPLDQIMEIMNDPAIMATDTMSRSKGEAAGQAGRDFSKGNKTNGQGGTAK